MATPCGRQVRQAKTRAKYNPIMKMKALYNPIMGAGFSVRPKLGLYITLLRVQGLAQAKTKAIYITLLWVQGLASGQNLGNYGYI